MWMQCDMLPDSHFVGWDDRRGEPQAIFLMLKLKAFTPWVSTSRIWPVDKNVSNERAISWPHVCTRSRYSQLFMRDISSLPSCIGSGKRDQSQKLPLNNENNAWSVFFIIIEMSLYSQAMMQQEYTLSYLVFQKQLTSFGYAKRIRTK